MYVCIYTHLNARRRREGPEPLRPLDEAETYMCMHACVMCLVGWWIGVYVSSHWVLLQK